MPGLKAKSGRSRPAAAAAPQAADATACPPAPWAMRVEHVVANSSRLRDHQQGLGPAPKKLIEWARQMVVQVTAVFIPGLPRCRRRRVPTALEGVALGLPVACEPVNVLSRFRHVAGRRALADPHASSGIWIPIHCCAARALVSAIHQTAQQAQPAVAAILDRIRASPVVHADETGWRQRPWEQRLPRSFQSPPGARILRLGSGHLAVVDDALTESSAESSTATRCVPAGLGGQGHRPTMAPDGAGPTCCRTSTTWWALPQRTPRNRGSISSMGQVFHPSSGTTTAMPLAGCPTGAAAAGRQQHACWSHLPVPPEPATLFAKLASGAICSASMEPSSSWPNGRPPSDNNRGAERCASSQPQGQRGQNVVPRARCNETGIIHLRHLAPPTRPEPLAACRQLLTSPQV